MLKVTDLEEGTYIVKFMVSDAPHVKVGKKCTLSALRRPTNGGTVGGRGAHRGHEQEQEGRDSHYSRQRKHNVMNVQKRSKERVKRVG